MKKQAATVHRKRPRVKLGRHTKHANKHRKTKASKGPGR